MQNKRKKMPHLGGYSMTPRHADIARSLGVEPGPSSGAFGPVKVPWEHPTPATPETGIRNVPTPEGRALGAELARMADAEEARFTALDPSIPPRCADCACRAGTRANGCGPSLMSLLKCVMEGTPFDCHLREGLCTGYLMLATAHEVEKAAEKEQAP